jgi:NAD(P)-dependent dehydrogenase (short-subunit alcohol dehydrogenase family)
MTNEKLSGRVGLVTGGGRGIGRAIAVGLANLGVRVAVLARSTAEVDETVVLAGARGEALGAPADVNNPDQVAGALRMIEKRWGPVEILVNNAAVVWPIGPSDEVDVEEWAGALAVNVTSVARLSFAVLGGMVAAGWGRIVNISSGIAANPGGMLRANAYATSKAALEGHTLNLAAELAGSGVTVNAYRPGGVDTQMQAWIRAQDPERIGPRLHESFVEHHQSGTLLTPDQSAAVLLGLLGSEETGQVWTVKTPLD